jgi:hypothetical protein
MQRERLGMRDELFDETSAKHSFLSLLFLRAYS